MAKLGKLNHNEKRKKLILLNQTRRDEYKKMAYDPSLSDEVRNEANVKLQKLPKNSSPIRYRNRCQVSGRPRGFYRKFNLSRIALREMALAGELTGVTKSSW